MLQIDWIDPQGKTWDLTHGTQGVRLATDQSGLVYADFERVEDDSQRLVSIIRKNVELDLAVEIGTQPWLSDTEYYRLADEWWSRSVSTVKPGTLRVERPDGVTRQSRFTLNTAPDVTWKHDPGMRSYDRPPEPWQLIATSPWWDDLTGIKTVSYSKNQGIGFKKLYDGAYPLNFSPLKEQNTARLQNDGVGPVYPKIEMTGYLKNPKVHVKTKQVDFTWQWPGMINESNVIYISTEPRSFKSTIADRSGKNPLDISASFNFPYSSFPPIGPGESVTAMVESEDIGENGKITFSFIEKYPRPF